MTTNEGRPTIRVVCTDCRFSKEVEKGGGEPAAVIVEHGRDTGHKLTTEETVPQE